MSAESEPCVLALGKQSGDGLLQGGNPQLPFTHSHTLTHLPPDLNVCRRRKYRLDTDHIPRPRNSFIIFRSSYANVLMDSLSAGADEQPKRQTDLSRFASMLWKAMTKEQKEPFVKEALLEKQAHLIRYPDYIYKPYKRGSERKKKVSASDSSYRRQDKADTEPCPVLPAASQVYGPADQQSTSHSSILPDLSTGPANFQHLTPRPSILPELAATSSIGASQPTESLFPELSFIAGLSGPPDPQPLFTLPFTAILKSQML